MKRILATLLSCTMLLTGCANNLPLNTPPSEHSQTTVVMETTDTSTVVESQSEAVPFSESATTENKPSDSTVPPEIVNNAISVQTYADEKAYIQSLGFLTLEDPDLLDYVENTVYTELENQLSSDDYVISEVSAIYMPKEYYADLASNSQENIYFGFTEIELDSVFKDSKYVFTLGDDGQNAIHELETLTDESYDKMMKNIAIGTGVILICVTVSVITGGAALPAVSAVFAASATTATEFAIGSAAFGAVSAAIVKGIQTRNIKETVKAAGVGASEGFKTGAIVGAVVGGASKGYEITKSSKVLKEAIKTGNPQKIGEAGEAYAQQLYKGRTQVSYLGGKEVPQSTAGATRPDIIRVNANGSIEAIEIKNYNLLSNSSRTVLKKELERQVSSRMVNLPEGSTQRIVLVTKNRNIPADVVEGVIKELQEALFDIYGGIIPIDVI